MTGMHYVSSEVTDKDHLIIIFSSTYNTWFLHPFSRLDNMDGFHLPGDSYFPDQGNGGWIDEEPEEENLVVPAIEDPKESSDE